MGSRIASGALLLALCGGCGKSGDVVSTGPADAASEAPAEATPPDDVTEIGAPLAGDWARLVDLHWKLQPGKEMFWCRRVKVTEDFWIRGLRAVMPRGTHHVTLSKLDGVLGTFPCSGVMPETNMLFGVGAGADALMLPAGSAAKVSIGDFLLVNVHVFNTSADPIEGTSGMEVVSADTAEGLAEAGFVFAERTLDLNVPPGKSTQTAQCTVGLESSLFAVVPHMHWLGVHEKVSVRRGDTLTALHDRDFDFNEQTVNRLADPFALQQGDVVEVECTYENPGTETVGFGESTNNEMCVAGLFSTPPLSNLSYCTL